MITLPSFVNKIAVKAPAIGIKVFSRLPNQLQDLVAGQVLNQILKSPIADGDLDFLSDKWLQLTLTDIQCRFYFTLKPCPHGNDKLVITPIEPEQIDVCFDGEINDLIQMAAKTVDPDTLFFQRKLLVTGDTELGLEIKNFLDALELEDTPQAVQKLISLQNNFIQQQA